MHPLKPLLASASLALATTNSNAATLLTASLTVTSPGTQTNTYSGSIGAVFTVGSSDLLVTSLGFQDLGNDGTQALNGDGLLGSHTVGIWNNTTNALVASILIQSGTASTLNNGYRYETLGSTITLASNTTYTIGALMNSTDRYISANSANNFTVSADATGGVSVFGNGGDTDMSHRPGSPGFGGSGGLSNRWGPANMQFDVVPEPSTTLLGGLGLLALMRRRR